MISHTHTPTHTHTHTHSVCACSVTSVVSDSLQPSQIVAHQAPLPMGFSRQEYWSGLSFPSPGDLLNPRTESVSYWQADSLPLSHLGSPPPNNFCLVFS